MKTTTTKWILMAINGFVLSQCIYAQDWENFTNTDKVTVIRESSNSIWAATNGGAVQIEKSTGIVTHHNIASGLWNNKIDDMEIDSNGVVWVAAAEKLGYYSNGKWHILEATSVKGDFFIDEKNTIWASQPPYIVKIAHGKVSKYVFANGGQLFAYPQPVDKIGAISGKLWISEPTTFYSSPFSSLYGTLTINDSLKADAYNAPVGELKTFPLSLRPKHIAEIKRINNDLYFAYHKRIGKFNTKDGWRVYAASPADTFTSTSVDIKNDLLYASNSENEIKSRALSIGKYDTTTAWNLIGTWRCKINNIHIDASNTLWIATDCGLVRKRTSETWNEVAIKNSLLPDNSVYKIQKLKSDGFGNDFMVEFRYFNDNAIGKKSSFYASDVNNKWSGYTTPFQFDIHSSLYITDSTKVGAFAITGSASVPLSHTKKTVMGKSDYFSMTTAFDLSSTVWFDSYNSAIPYVLSTATNEIISFEHTVTYHVNGAWQKVNLSGNFTQVKPLAEDKDGMVYFATQPRPYVLFSGHTIADITYPFPGGLLIYKDNNFYTIDNFNSKFINDVVVDGDRIIVAYGKKSTAIDYKGETNEITGGFSILEDGKWTHYTAANSAIELLNVQKIKVDANGNIWAYGDNLEKTGYKLVAFNGSEWSYYDQSNTNVSFSHIQLSDMEFDLHGNLLIATNNGLLSLSNALALAADTHIPTADTTTTVEVTTDTTTIVSGDDVTSETTGDTIATDDDTNSVVIEESTVTATTGADTAHKELGIYSSDVLANRLAVFPDPFAGSAQLLFNAAEPGNLIIDLYDVKGTRVQSISNQSVQAGNNLITFYPENLPDGMYCVRIKFNNSGFTKTVIHKN